MAGTSLIFMLMLVEVAAVRHCYKYSTSTYQKNVYAYHTYVSPGGYYEAYTCDDSLACCGDNTCCTGTKYCVVNGYRYYNDGSRYREDVHSYRCENDKFCCGFYSCCSLYTIDDSPSAGYIFGGMFGGLLFVVMVSTIISCFLCKGCYGHERYFAVKVMPIEGV